MKILILLAAARLFFGAISLNAQNSDLKTYGLTPKQHQQFEKYWHRRSKIMNIQLKNSSNISGQGIFIQNNKLFILQQPEIFLNPSDLNSQIAIVTLKDIAAISLVDRLDRKRPRNIGIGIGTGIGIIMALSIISVGDGYIPLYILPFSAVAFGLPAGLLGYSFFPSRQEISIYTDENTTASASQIVSPLLIFPDSLPNAIKINENGLMEAVADSENSLNEMMSASPLMKKIFHNPKIAISGNIGTTLLINDGLGYADHMRGFGLMYALNQHLNLEYNFNYSEQILYTRFNQTLNGGYLFEHNESRSNKRNHAFYLHYNLLPIKQFSNKHVRIAIAAGVNVSNWVGEVKYNYSRDVSDFNSSLPRTVREDRHIINDFENNIVGFHTKLEVEYKLIKNFSIYSNLDKSFISKRVYPSYEFTHPNTGQRVIDESHQSIRLSGLDWNSGIRIWLY